MTMLVEPDRARRIIPALRYLLLLTASLSCLAAQDDGPPFPGTPRRCTG